MFRDWPSAKPRNITRLLAALGQSAATPLNLTSLAQDVGGARGSITSETLANYMDAPGRLMLIEPVPAWRSRTRLRASAAHHFVDPSLGTAA